MLEAYETIPPMTAAGDTTAARIDTHPRSTRPTRTRLGRFAQGASSELILLLALAGVVASAGPLITDQLPGIEPTGDDRRMELATALTAALLPATVVMLQFATLARPHVGPRWSDLMPAWRRTQHVARVLVDHLGLLPRGRVRQVLGAGVLAGTGAFLAGPLLARLLPALAATDDGPDARQGLVDGAQPWASALFLGFYATGFEELTNRALLLLVVAAIAWWMPQEQKALRLALVTAAVAASSLLFGAGHLHWSPLDAVATGLSGAFFALAAVWTRSLWSSFLAHVLCNAGVGVAWVLLST